MTLDDILEQIDKANTIVILTHENPDGDAIFTRNKNIKKRK